MGVDAASLYLDLMKKTLSFSLWPEPPMPLEAHNYLRSPLQRRVVGTVSNLLKRWNMQIIQHDRYSAEARADGKVWPGYADTMIGLKRLDNLQYCVEQVIKDGVPGDFIETGVWRGGSCIFVRAIFAVHNITDRKVFVADSFAGLPKPNPEKWPADRDDVHHTHDNLAISKEQVAQNFRRYGLLDDQVVFIEGFFEDTLPTAPIERLAVLRLDGDMYGSTMDAFNNLYHKLQPGGFCIIDDYGLKGCAAAVDDFRKAQGITEPMHEVDWTGRYWRKA